MTIDERKECFIRKAIEKWGDLYDYSNVRYINARTKVEIVNKENGRRFWITVYKNLRKIMSLLSFYFLLRPTTTF